VSEKFINVIFLSVSRQKYCCLLAVPAFLVIAGIIPKNLLMPIIVDPVKRNAPQASYAITSSAVNQFSRNCLPWTVIIGF
jgi:hypothetical protein